MSNLNRFPVDTLRDFIVWHVTRGTDYATAFAKACGPFGDVDNFEESFDKYWDHYDALPKLQN
jgi:hypothetical protein